MLLRGDGDTIETSFGHVLAELARDRQVVAFEQQGCGRTADIAGQPWTIHASPEVFYAVGRERGTVRLASGETFSLAMRTTRVFKKVNGVWKQVRHHGSFDDPKLLEKYQTALKKTDA